MIRSAATWVVPALLTVAALMAACANGTVQTPKEAIAVADQALASGYRFPQEPGAMRCERRIGGLAPGVVRDKWTQERDDGVGSRRHPVGCR